MDLARSIGERLPQSLRRLFRSDRASQLGTRRRYDLGKQGERLAALFLRKSGYKILFRNFRSKRGGEIDLVCRDIRENTLVFVEVKTRKTDAFGRPHDAVTHAQRERIIRGAKEWLRMLDDPRVSYRFDIVEVVMDVPPQITLLRNAFEMRDDIYY
jgi:putative endonuclease